jgi:flagellar motor switch protein FliM
MPEIGTSNEITALLAEARQSVSAVQAGDQSQNAAAFDLRQSKPISDGKLRGVSHLQEAFARKLTESLSSYLRTTIEAKVNSVELASISGFVKDLPEPLYLAALRLPGLDSNVLLYVELPLVFQIVDLMLGGDGKDQPAERDLTEIEEEIFESAARIICEELRAAWRPVLDTEIRFDRRQRKNQINSLIPASERLLLSNFDVTLNETQFKFTLALPGAVSTALLRNIVTEPVLVEPKNSQKNRARIQQLLGNCQYDTELMLPPSTVFVRDLYSLQPGGIIVLNIKATDPIHLKVAGKDLFLASPVSCGPQRGAQIEKLLSIAPPKEKK